MNAKYCRRRAQTYPLPIAKVGTPPLPVAFPLVVLLQAEAFRTLVIRPQLLGQPHAEGPLIIVLGQIGGVGLRLGHLRKGSILRRIGEDRVGDVDREGRVSRRPSRFALIFVFGVLAAEDPGLEFLEAALLRHGGQRQRRRDGGEKTRGRRVLASC